MVTLPLVFGLTGLIRTHFFVVKPTRRHDINDSVVSLSVDTAITCSAHWGEHEQEATNQSAVVPIE